MQKKEVICGHTENVISFLIITIIILVAISVIGYNTYQRAQNDNTTDLNILHRGFQGYYLRGIITIRAYTISNISSHDELIFLANHEWAHHVMATKFAKGDLLLWKKATDKCGINSSYAKTYKSKTVRVEEEWADSYALYFVNNVSLCPEKIAVIKRYI
jgi:hypothetical protein